MVYKTQGTWQWDMELTRAAPGHLLATRGHPMALYAPRTTPRGVGTAHSRLGCVGWPYRAQRWPDGVAADHSRWAASGRIGRGMGACTALQGARWAGHGPRGPLGPVGCGGGRGAPPCASHRPISTLERPFPAAMGGAAAGLGITNPECAVRPLLGLGTCDGGGP